MSFIDEALAYSKQAKPTPTTGGKSAPSSNFIDEALTYSKTGASPAANAQAASKISGVDTSLATQMFSRGSTPQQVSALPPTKQPSFLNEVGSAAKGAVTSLGQDMANVFKPNTNPTLPITPSTTFGAGQGNNLNKENILPPGPTNALAALPKEDSVKFSLTEQPKLSQNFTGLQKIQNQVANERGDVAYREQARQERVNQILIPAMYAGGAVAAAEIGTAGSLAAAGKVAFTTGANVALFSALQMVEDKLNIHLANYLPQEGTLQQQDNAKIVADLLQVIGNGLLTHGIMKKAPAVATAFTKNTIEYYNLPREVNIPASVIKDIFQTGKMATPEQLDLFTKITGGDRAKINSAIQNGLDVTIPAEGVTKLVDKPYWAKIKEVLRLSPTDEVLSSKQFGKVAQAPKALIGNNPLEKMDSEKFAEVLKKYPGLSTELPAIERQLALSSPQEILRLPAPTTKSPIQGSGFLMTDKADKNNLAISKRLNDYREAVRHFTDKPTPTSLKKVLTARDALSSIVPTQSLADQLASRVSELPPPEAKPTQADIMSSEVAKVPVKTSEPTLADKMKQVTEPQTQTVIQPQVIEQKVSQAQATFGEGKDKVSRLEARMKGVLDNASEEDIKNLGLSTYKEMNDKVILHKSAEYVTNHSSDKILKILSGELPEPKGIPKEALFVAISNAEGSPELYTKIATLSSTGIGQRMQLLSQIDPNSPVKILGDIFKIKEANFTKSTGKTRKQIEKEVGRAIDSIAKPTKQNWADFVKEITCK